MKSNNEKGRELEDSFADWAEEKYDFEIAELRELINGAVSARPYEVDIHALKARTEYLYLKRAGIALMLLSGLLLLGFIPDIREYLEDIVRTISPENVPLSVFLPFSIGFFAYYFGNKKKEKHYWIECKNLKSKVNRAHVQKLHSSVDDVRNNEQAPWYPDKVFLVSGNGFDKDALAHADEFEIKCFERHGKKFIRV